MFERSNLESIDYLNIMRLLDNSNKRMKLLKSYDNYQVSRRNMEEDLDNALVAICDEIRMEGRDESHELAMQQGIDLYKDFDKDEYLRKIIVLNDRLPEEESFEKGKIYQQTRLPKQIIDWLQNQSEYLIYSVYCYLNSKDDTECTLEELGINKNVCEYIPRTIDKEGPQESIITGIYDFITEKGSAFEGITNMGDVINIIQDAKYYSVLAMEEEDLPEEDSIKEVHLSRNNTDQEDLDNFINHIDFGPKVKEYLLEFGLDDIYIIEFINMNFDVNVINYGSTIDMMAMMNILQSLKDLIKGKYLQLINDKFIEASKNSARYKDILEARYSYEYGKNISFEMKLFTLLNIKELKFLLANYKAIGPDRILFTLKYKPKDELNEMFEVLYHNQEENLFQLKRNSPKEYDVIKKICHDYILSLDEKASLQKGDLDESIIEEKISVLHRFLQKVNF